MQSFSISLLISCLGVLSVVERGYYNTPVDVLLRHSLQLCLVCAYLGLLCVFRGNDLFYQLVIPLLFLAIVSPMKSILPHINLAIPTVS